MCISASVGRNGQNRPDDVKTIQILLNLNLGSLVPLRPIAVNGNCSGDTVGAIDEFQRRALNIKQPDGRVDATGNTLATLRAKMPTGFSNAKLWGIMIRGTSGSMDRYFRPLEIKMAEYQINTPLRKAHFLAQIAHESYDLTYAEEVASGDAYEGRLDLGNTEKGDGRRFKGRGLIQLTGRKNYKAYGDAKGRDYLTDDTAKQIARDPVLAVDVSCWFWQEKGLNALADADDVSGATLAINGGFKGLPQREAKLKRAKFFLIK